MVVAKDKPEYVALDPNFKPLPKYGHLSELDPEFAKLKEATDQMVNQIWEPSLSLEAFRKMWLNDSAPPEGCPTEGVDVMTETQQIPMRDGGKVEIKVYKSKDKKPDSALVMRFHGGGWVVGGHCTEHSENLLIAGRTNSVVVSVDYRMAPEFRFPYSANDCLDGLKWSKENASSLGVDPEKIILAGGSAGGNLAAVVALMARDESISGIVAQVLCFPVTCHPKFLPKDKYEFGSYRQNYEASIVTSARLEWFLDHYMPEPTPDWRLSCLLAPSLKDLPPALVMIAGYDALRDEGLAYAERLEEEGVETEVHTYQGMPHCFYMFPAHPKALDYFDQVVKYVGRFSG
ncbi:alpha/beta hydrolase fold-domain-containing protein [Ilyonectria robusta]|uniref:alpha/beta hydrolase fold-domain-containing protein n=1 Tax=Ilyonectria robusta TaxID=1079257 RepID=UPI001E8EA858|nr:alpha/beta hydrolase fold-domain-containing protein [Ilyonectria robusta]KAH8699481.1 alpha/beta hydrolase fold-domain-containing protein [Ilyonectria robusta]